MTNAEIRIDGMLKNIDKSRKTLSRHESQLEKKRQECIKLGIDNPDTWDKYTEERTSEQYWAKCDYDNKKQDVEDTKKKINEFTERLQYWREQKSKEDAKNDIPVIPAIEDFLAGYRTMLDKWYREQVVTYNTWEKEFKAKKETGKVLLTEKYGEERMYFWFRDVEILKEMSSLQIDDNFHRKYVNTHWSAMVRLLSCESGNEFESKLNKELDKTVQNLKVDLFYRCSAAVGVITDASGLFISNNGSINGIVTGENGKAKVETILAGGYNIQCIHFRVLVNPIKDLNNTEKCAKNKENKSIGTTFNYSEKTLQELIQMAEGMKVDYKTYSDERITRMRLVMELKKVM